MELNSCRVGWGRDTRLTSSVGGGELPSAASAAESRGPSF